MEIKYFSIFSEVFGFFLKIFSLGFWNKLVWCWLVSSGVFLLFSWFFFYCLVTDHELRILPGTYALSITGSCKNICRQRSFCANGWPATLLINCSKPFLRSSIKSSSKMPSSLRNGSWRFQAFPGNCGTTIFESRSSSERSHSKSL